MLAYNQSHWVFLTVAVIIGFGKGLRTVFMALVIPTHVPLHKLPGATGIQLLTAGIVYIVLGPVVGKCIHVHVVVVVAYMFTVIESSNILNIY